MPLFHIGRLLLLLLLLAMCADGAMLWLHKAIRAGRQCSNRFSNGDDNVVRIWVESDYPFRVTLEIIDEIPHVFQRRDVCFRLSFRPQEGKKELTYSLRPTSRGVYGFGYIRVFAASPHWIAAATLYVW